MPFLFHFNTAGLSLKSSSKARLVSTTAALQPRFNKLLLLTSGFLIASAQGCAKSDSKREGGKGRVRGEAKEWSSCVIERSLFPLGKVKLRVDFSICLLT